jgi:OOP family OmpA-OmpF porin
MLHRHLAVSLAALLCAEAARADDRPLPPELGFVTKIIELRDPGYVYPGYTYLEWSDYDFGSGIVPTGRYWKLRGTVKGDTAATTEGAWKIVKTAFLDAGWKVRTETATAANFQITTHGVRSDAQTGFIDGDEVITVIEAAPNPLKLELRKPAATREKIEPDKGDFPYLAPPPGSKLISANESTTPFWVKLPGASSPEHIADTSLSRRYERPRSLSNLEFVTAYHDALTKAGWEIIAQTNSGDATLTAHYGKNGRSLWAYLHIDYGAFVINVADAATDLKASLTKDCHVALYGILFDFDKATLQPASDAVLEKVLALIKSNASLKLEIQGHTDDRGDAAYNQTLSEHRAETVVAWLEKHGIARSRLTSHGYGKSQPIADNGTDEGRARNRRVEMADPACQPKP